MPCLSYEPERDREPPVVASELRDQILNLEAALCAALHVVEKHAEVVGHADALALLDFAEAGISEKKVRAWWTDHKQKDAARREREAAKRRKADLKKSALAKLSAEERAALGIK